MSVVQFTEEKEYEKNPDINKKDVGDIRKWLQKQNHLPHTYITDLDIILAHHCCDHKTELTKRFIDLNYTLRTLFSFYSHRQLDKSLQLACHTWLITPLKVSTLFGYRAIYCHLLDPDPKNFVYSDVVRAFLMIIDLYQHEEGTWTGVSVVVDMSRVSLSHVAAIDLAVAQQFFYFLQQAMFICLKEFHFINCPSFVDKMLSLLSPFMKKELSEILKVHHAGSNTLYKYLPKDSLPKEAGGEYKDCPTLRDDILQKIEANARFFEMEAKKRVDESKRSGGPVTLASLFPSAEETFKNLSID